MYTIHMNTNEIGEFGVLGVLAEGRADLETIHDRLQHTVGRYWTAGHGVLEPTLDRLQSAGHVAAVPVSTEGGETKTAFEITADGRERFREFLRRPVPADAVVTRQPQFVLQIGFLHHLPPAEQADQLAALEDRVEQERNRWLDVIERHEAASDDPAGYRRDLQDLTVRLYDTYREWFSQLDAPTA